jgi:hypothetical protein
MMRQYDQAITEAQKAIELDPNFFLARKISGDKETVQVNPMRDQGTLEERDIWREDKSGRHQRRYNTLRRPHLIPTGQNGQTNR